MKKIFLFLLCFIAALALWAAAPAANALAEEELSLSLSHAVSSNEKPVSGENFTLTFTADEGYSLPSSLTLVINGVSLEEDEYTFENGVLFVEGARVTGKVEITLQALPNENTPYTEKHYVEDAEGDVIYLETHFRLYSQEAKQGVTDTQVSAQEKEMEGYHLFAAPQTTVLGNGEGVAEAYYLVNEYALTAESCENGVIEIQTPTVRHGETGVFRVLPNAYYHVEKVFVEGVEQMLREQYEIVITHNTQVSALFAGNYVQGVYASDVHAVYNGTAHGLTLPRWRPCGI